MSEFSEMLRSLNSNTFSIDRAIEFLVSSANTNEISADLIQNRGQELSVFYQRQQQIISDLQLRLAHFYSKEDSDFDTFLDILTSYIKDPISAMNAAQMYDVGWFRRLDFSTKAKIAMAQKLIDVVSRYNTSYCSTLWHSIVTYNPEILRLITVA